MQVDLTWLELILADLGQIDLTRFNYLELFLINDLIKPFNLINPTRHDWRLATCHAYPEDEKFGENYQNTLQQIVIVQFNLLISYYPD